MRLFGLLNIPVRNEEWVDSKQMNKKGRGRPKIALVEVIKKGMSIQEVYRLQSMTFDIVEWQKRIHVPELN